ncbi:Cof-type HAD-IIB family hydrolase [Paenibacillus hamazuiensis]|uniref:Cof-type HAD-IIB family hydrolase n=1 Tax=Paenibacillus hamazuiensis TaxID=2936508 RepID=UPI00200D3373|nr:HAD family hydrolase [Paenibacillus hamazuiensis]
MIKLVAFDVDGTLRDNDYLPESTREALRRLRQSGVALSLCTGRSEFEMASLREELGIDWAVTCNGSHIGYRGKTVFGTSLQKDKVRMWLQKAEKLNHTLLLYGAEQMWITRTDDPLFRRAQQEIGFMEPLPLGADWADQDVYQCIAFIREEEQREYIEEGERYYLHRWRPWAVDINPEGLNKAVGLHRLMNRLGLSPDEVAAFGDSTNDHEMIESVGAGIAMGNATDLLKSKARFVTKPLHEGGIAYAVDRWILTGSGQV